MSISRRSLLGISAAAIASSKPQNPTKEELAGMNEVATTFMHDHDVPGMSLAVGRGGMILHQKGYGFADRDHDERVTPAHLFRIASVSKPITSVAIFQLIQRGKLHLDDFVFGSGAILGTDFGAPPYQRHITDIRLEHLLTHTAGGWQNDAADPMFRNRAMNHRQLIAWALQEMPLLHAPGEQFAYSNFGYCVLGRVIENVTGRPYEQHVQSAVLAPCGITGMRIAGDTLAQRTKGEVVYYGAGGQFPYTMQVRRMDSHGGWLATASDLVRFAGRIEALLPPPVIAEMTTPSRVNTGYACGWAVNKAPNWWHTGSLPGTTSIMVRTASGFQWAALLNTREAHADTGAALDHMMWEMVRKVKSWNA
jgi:CubicO group peptidase (beta-lactamase class C family)